MSYEDLLAQSDKLAFFMITAIVIFIIISIGICYYMSNSLSKPIKKLTNSVASLHENGYNPTFIHKYHDEIGDLSQSIHTMCILINSQIEQIKIEENKNRQTESTMLLQQINPHFLYNTLEFIHSEIVNEHSENAKKMVESLGEFLRSSLKLGTNTTTLENEIRHAENYLKIVNLCSGLDIPLYVNANQNDDYIIIEIIDNGVGINIDRTMNIMNAKDKTTHIGLANIKQRLSFIYKDNYSIEINSIPFWENKFTFRLPNV